jgi:putative SOS response-associated peptidase YedK
MLRYAAKIVDELEVPDPMPEFTDHAFPKSMSPIIVEEDGRRRVQMHRWGISHVVKGKLKLITNSRDDQLQKFSVWRELTSTRRCLIPLVAYFEPGLGPEGAKGELLFTIKDRPVFFVAGLWTVEEDGVKAYSMVTTSPNAYTRPFHDRQPVVLSDADALTWLGSQPLQSDRVFALTRPPPDEVMQHQVLPAVPKEKKITKSDMRGATQTGELDLGLF